MPEILGSNMLHYASGEKVTGTGPLGKILSVVGPFLARLHIRDPEDPEDPFILELQISGAEGYSDLHLMLDDESAAEVPLDAYD